MKSNKPKFKAEIICTDGSRHEIEYSPGKWFEDIGNEIKAVMSTLETFPIRTRPGFRVVCDEAAYMARPLPPVNEWASQQYREITGDSHHQILGDVAVIDFAALEAWYEAQEGAL